MPRSEKRQLARFLTLLVLFCLGVPSASHYCTMKQFTTGKWLPVPDLERKAFVCCGWDTNDWRDSEIKEECGPYDMGDKLRRMVGRTDYNVQVGGHACTCDEILHERKVVSSREKWRWQPEGCDVLPWNATQFCEQLGPRKVLLFGDSTTVQAGSTIVNMILGDEPRGTCGPHFYIFRMDMALENLGEIKQIIRDFQPAFVLANFGPHYHNVDHISREVEEFMVNMTEFRLELPENNRPLFIWKTISSPHFSCEKYTQPVSEPIIHDTGTTDYYQWDLFPHYDNASVLSARRHDFLVMDVSMLKLRPDGHPGMNAYQWAKAGGDCLHFCMPGPLNVLTTMFHHIVYHHPLQISRR